MSKKTPTILAEVAREGIQPDPFYLFREQMRSAMRRLDRELEQLEDPEGLRRELQDVRDELDGILDNSSIRYCEQRSLNVDTLNFHSGPSLSLRQAVAG